MTGTVVRRYNRELHALAAEMNDGGAWPVTVVRTETISDTESFPDGAGHPNREGCARMAGAIVDAYLSAQNPVAAELRRGSWCGPNTSVRGTVIHRGTGSPVGFSDTFTRANNVATMGDPPWVSVQGAWGIIDNCAYHSDGGSNPWETAVVMVDPGTADTYVEATVGPGAVPANNHGICFRGTDQNNFWSLVVSTDLTGWSLRHVVAGVNTPVAQLAGAHTAGTRIGLRGEGDQVSVYIDGDWRGTYTSPVHQTATLAGFVAPADVNTFRWDSFLFRSFIEDVRNLDWYLDTAGPSLYGPYNTGEWGSSILLAGGGGGSAPDATAGTKGLVRLAQDLGGTADAPTVPGLAGKQSTSAKDQASGYCGLNANSRVSAARLGTGSTGTGTRFLTDAETWIEPGGGGPVTGFVSATGGGKETVHTVAAAGAAPAPNLVDGNVFNLGLNTNCAPTFTGATVGVACTVTVVARQDATGGRTLTLPASFLWPGGTTPMFSTAPNAWNVITATTLDGGVTWFAGVVGVGYA